MFSRPRAEQQPSLKNTAMTWKLSINTSIAQITNVTLYITECDNNAAKNGSFVPLQLDWENSGFTFSVDNHVHVEVSETR